MPRQMSAGLIEVLNRKDKNIETHSTLEMFVVIGAETRSFFFATATLNFNGVVWQPQLRKTGAITSSLTRAANRAQIDLQNVDTLLGHEFLSIHEFLFGAEAKVGRYWRDVDTGTEWHDRLLTGLITGVEPNEQAVQLTVIADMYASVSVGPLRQIKRLCQWRPFKGPECGYIGPESVCDYTLNGTGGCQGRHGDPLKFAKHGGFPFLDNKAELQII